MIILRGMLAFTILALSFSCKYPSPYRPLFELLEPGIYGLEIITDSDRIYEHQTVQAHAMAIQADGRKSELFRDEVVWESLSPGIVSVDGDGAVTGLSAGIGGIRVLYGDMTACDEITVAVKPDYGSVMLSEVLCDPEGSDDGREYIELYNDGDRECEISGLRIIDGNTGSTPFVFPAASVIQAKGRLIIAQSADGFFGLFGADPDYAGLTFALNNSGETVMLVLPDGVVADAVFIRGGSAEYPAPDTWGSGTLPSSQSGYSVQRINSFDSDTFSDWTSGLPSPWK
jgi:hypothetical protein